MHRLPLVYILDCDRVVAVVFAPWRYIDNARFANELVKWHLLLQH